MAFIEVCSELYFGFPLEVKVGRPEGITKNDWVGIYDGERRVSYEWVKPPSDLVRFNFDLGRNVQVPIGGAFTMTIRYFTGGGYFTNGTKVIERVVRLANPLTRLQCSLLTDSILLSYDLAISLPHGGAKLTSNGVRIGSSPLDASPQRSVGRKNIPVPRVAGKYEVSVLANTVSNSVLGSQTVIVPQGPQNTYSLQLSAHGGAYDTAAVAVAPGSTISVKCGGALQQNDEVVIVECNEKQQSSAKNLVDPDAPAMQMPRAVQRLNSNGEAQITLPNAQGLYHVCLALKHQTGATLCGASGVALVTSKARPGQPLALQATEAPPSYRPPPQYSSTSKPQSSPPPAAAAASSNSGDERFLCVICR